MPGALLAAALTAATCIALITGCRDTTPGPPVDAGGLDPPRAVLTDGEAFYRAGEFDSAETRFRSALDLARRQGDPAIEAAATLALARVAYRRDDEYAEARKLALEALALQTTHRLADQQFESHTLLGLIAYDEGHYLESVEQQETARDLALAAADTTNLLKAWTNLGLAQFELGQAVSARGNLEAALAVAPTHGTALHEGRILLNLGMLAIRTGHPEDGVVLLERGRPRMREAGDWPAELNLLGHMGIAYAAMGEPGRAIAYLDSARTEARARDDTQEEASAVEHMAAILLDAGEYPRALRLYHEANALNERLGLEDEAAANLRSIGEIHLSLESLDLAASNVREALAAHRRIGARLNLLEDLLLLARIASRSSDVAAAAGYLDEARAVADALDTRAARLTVALAGARVADRVGDSRGTLAAIAAVRSDLTGGAAERGSEVHWLAMRALERLGQLDQAAEEGERAVAAVERIRGGFGSGALRTSFLSDREEVYRDLVDLRLRQGRVDEAFETADRARGRALVEHLATLRADGGPSVRDLAEEELTLLQQEGALSDAIANVRSVGERVTEAAMRAELDRLNDELDRTRAAYTSALTRADERDAIRMAIAGGQRPDAGRIRRAVRPGEALLEFLVEPERVVLFVVRPDRIVHFEIPSTRGVTTTRVRVARELTGRPASLEAPSAALEALHDLLLGAARRSDAFTGVGSLIIVPHGELTYVPFAALRNPATGRYLVEDFSLLHLPSASALPVLRDRPTDPSARRVAFAPFARELPGTSAEAGAAADLLKAESVRGGRATEASVRGALKDASLVHLATHGVLNVRNPLFSRVELWRGQAAAGVEDDGRLEVHEINRLPIRAELVFLSGCETGLGAVGSTAFSTGEDYETLERAFLQAGAANVAATLWRIEDEGAAELVRRFYTDLASGADRGLRSGPGRLADALARAQREMIRDPVHGSPYYWAGFRLSGSGDWSATPVTRSAGTSNLSVGRAQGIQVGSVPERHGPLPRGRTTSWG